MKVKSLYAAAKRSSKLAVVVAAVAGALIIPTALHAWGPDRPTYTIQNPADHVTFDSITNNPSYGDERNFVSIKDLSASNATFTDNIALQADHEYQVYVYYHNNAASNLNASGVGIAKNVMLRMEMPSVIKAGTSDDINGYISASNATPGTVYDNATMSASVDTALRYVSGSATIHNGGSTNGKTLPDSIMTTGTPLGYNALDGTIPGCNDYAGYVLFDIKAEVPNFNVTKQVSTHNQNQFSSSINAKSGDTVDYKVEYSNTGDVDQDNVVIKDTLPAGETYVAGSTKISNGSTGNKFTSVSSDALVGTGVNIGTYIPGSVADLEYSAVVNGPCGTTLTNKVSANTDNGTKYASANVVLTGTCSPTPTPTPTPTPSSSPTPTSLPDTGTSNGVMTVFGIGGLTAAAAYAIRSKNIRSLLRR